MHAFKASKTTRKGRNPHTQASYQPRRRAWCCFRLWTKGALDAGQIFESVLTSLRNFATAFGEKGWRRLRYESPLGQHRKEWRVTLSKGRGPFLCRVEFPRRCLCVCSRIDSETPNANLLPFFAGPMW